MRNLSSLKDSELVEKIREDSSLYVELMYRYQKKLLRYVMYLTNNSADAEDVVQETFIKVYQNLNGFDPKYEFSSWIYRIAHNQAINSLKKNRFILELDFAFNLSSSQDLETEYSSQELIELIKSCLAKLPPNKRALLTLYYLEEKSYREISDILRISVSTVGVGLNRAKSYLRKLCQKTK